MLHGQIPKNEGKNDRVPTFFYVKILRWTRLISVAAFLYHRPTSLAMRPNACHSLSYAGSESCPLPLAHTLLEWELNKEESENANQFHFFCDNFALGHYCSNLVPPRAKSVRELSAYQIF